MRERTRKQCNVSWFVKGDGGMQPPVVNHRARSTSSSTSAGGSNRLYGCPTCPVIDGCQKKMFSDTVVARLAKEETLEELGSRSGLDSRG